MGYTHYWKQTKKAKSTDFGRATAIIADMIAGENAADIIKVGERFAIVYDYDEPTKKPKVTKTTVRFNGVGEFGHETFLVINEPTAFDFCKTNRKPYDKYVLASLMIIAAHVPEFSWSSDGCAEDGEFDDATELFNKYCSEVIAG